MISVLFVDDEPNVLDALRVALRPRRKAWRMLFAGSGQEAMKVLDAEHLDVVVSDLRMPGIDGAQVLKAAQERQPWAARVVLSGFADLETTLRAVPFAHQHLSKPCPVDVITDVVERGSQLVSLLNNEAVRAVAGRVTSLPSLPENFAAMQAAIASGDASAASIARVLERDVAMCAKVLQLVNSAYFGVPRPVHSIEEAVVLLGFNLVRNLALAGEVFRGGSAELRELELHSMAVAGLARQLAPNREVGDDACLAGMLHDLGKVVLSTAWPGQCAEDDQRSRETGRPVCEFEQERLGTTHAEVGAYLLGLWGVQPNVIEVVAHHHAPARVGKLAPPALIAVAVADALVHEVEGRAIPRELEAFLSREDSPPGRLAELRRTASRLRAG